METVTESPRTVKAPAPEKLYTDALSEIYLVRTCNASLQNENRQLKRRVSYLEDKADAVAGCDTCEPIFLKNSTRNLAAAGFVCDDCGFQAVV
jgi:hypothetical protein